VRTIFIVVPSPRPSGSGRTAIVAHNIDITGTDNVDGMPVLTKAPGLELAKKLSAICNKVFAARCVAVANVEDTIAMAIGF